MPPREIPKASDLQAFNYAVAGHAGTLCDADGVLFIKPCVQDEIDFYEAVRDGHPELADLMPLFMGTLMLNNTAEAASVAAKAADAPGVAAVLPADVRSTLAELPVPPAAAPVDNETWVARGSQSIKTDRAVVLENATYGFRKPNVLDVKLGRRLWGDKAPMQKRRRMDEVCAQTTHATYGFRIAGMRVYGGEGAAGASGAASVDDSGATLDAAGYRIYDKDFGRTKVNDDNVVDAFRQFLFNPAAGVDDDHARAIALAFKSDLERVRDVLEKERTRMYSSSLLFIFEGDGAALRAAIEDANSRAHAAEARRCAARRARRRRAQPPSAPVSGEAAEAETDASRSRDRREPLGKAADRSSSRTDSGIVIDDDESDQYAEGEDETSDMGDNEYGDDDDDDEGEDSDSDDGKDALPHIYGLRLIDFAHAKFVPPEEGPDESVLVGIRSLIRIFDELSK